MERVSNDKNRKYSGIYINRLKNGTISYYIAYRDENDKIKKEKVGISPDMNKTKALELLNKKKEKIKEIKKALKTGTPISFYGKKKKQNKVYTLNELADFYFEDNKVKTTKDMTVKYNYHVRNEAFANKPIQLITREDLIDFMGRKKLQRSDKRRSKHKGLSVEEKELGEFEKNKTLIQKLKERIESSPEEDMWREKNKIKYLEKKNSIIVARHDSKFFQKIMTDGSMSIDERRHILGLDNALKNPDNFLAEFISTSCVA